MVARTPDYHVDISAITVIPVSVCVSMYRTMCRIRAFEQCVYRAMASGRITSPVYLSTGQESIAAALAQTVSHPWALGQHRGHGLYLAWGGDLGRLRDELLGLPTGCCRGMGGSPCIQDWEAGIIGHNGLIGDHIPVSVGVAFADRSRTTVCVFGDGAGEEDYVYGAWGFASTHRLPILFVCEDNDLSVLTPTADRRAWSLVDVARGLGLWAADLADDPWTLCTTFQEALAHLPAFVNVRTCRTYWHVGAGQDYPPEWDRFVIVTEQLRDKLLQAGVPDSLPSLVLAAGEEMDVVWA